MKLYRIKNWSSLYENNRSREIVRINWLPIPNTHDGEGYTLTLARKDGPELFGAWIIILQIASKCGERGTLLRDTQKPHDPESISRLTRFPETLIKKALDWFSSEDIQWIESEEVTQNPAAECDATAVECGNPAGGCLERKKERIEGKNIVEDWNCLPNEFPKVKNLSDGRSKTLQARLKDDWWLKNYQSALKFIPERAFLCGKNDRGWIANFDWFIKPDSVAKIMEGEYKNQNGKPETSAKPLSGDFND